jgi:hypothetical protein
MVSVVSDQWMVSVPVPDQWIVVGEVVAGEDTTVLVTGETVVEVTTRLLVSAYAGVAASAAPPMAASRPAAARTGRRMTNSSNQGGERFAGNENRDL